MKELKELESIIEEELIEIRRKEHKVLNDYTKYEELQQKLRDINKVINMLKEYKIEEV